MHTPTRTLPGCYEQARFHVKMNGGAHRQKQRFAEPSAATHTSQPHEPPLSPARYIQTPRNYTHTHNHDGEQRRARRGKSTYRSATAPTTPALLLIFILVFIVAVASAPSGHSHQQLLELRARDVCPCTARQDARVGRHDLRGGLCFVCGIHRGILVPRVAHAGARRNCLRARDVRQRPAQQDARVGRDLRGGVCASIHIVQPVCASPMIESRPPGETSALSRTAHRS